MRENQFISIDQKVAISVRCEKEKGKRSKCNHDQSIFTFNDIKYISMSFRVFSRYTGASAAVNTWDQ